MGEIGQKQEVWDEFHSVVNMTSRELRAWLVTDAATERSEALPDQPRSETGLRVLEILGKRQTDLAEHDLDVMRAVIDLVRAENPDPDAADASDARWRRQLMTVGHDPLKAASG